VFSNWDFLRAAVFGGVYKALDMFEDEDTLGRKVRWAFPGPQLLIVPRAGEWANAYYERESRSLQLFFVTEADGRRVYTCQSQDIIGHETAHHHRQHRARPIRRVDAGSLASGRWPTSRPCCSPSRAES
jgi:hypothetical protein